MTLDQRLRTAVEEMHDYGRTLEPSVLQPQRRRLTHRRALAFALAATVLVAIIGLAAVLAPFGGEEAPFVDETTPTPVTTMPSSLPEAGTPTTSSRAPDTTVAGAPAESAIGWATVTWTRVSDSAGALGGTGTQYAQAVVSGGPGFVAVGSDCGGRCGFQEGEEAWDAAVWVSTDGISWQRIPHDEEVFGGPGSQDILDVVEGGPGLVAVGIIDHAYYGARRSPQEFRPDEFATIYGLETRFERDDLDAAVWTSADGIVWQRVEDADGIFSGPADGSSADSGDFGMEAVTVGEGLIVAVGSAHGDAAVWVSSDGVSWERVPHDDAVLGGPSGQWMHDVVYTGERFVAVGTDLNQAETGEGIMRGSVWTSEDGYNWSRVPNDPAVFGGEVDSEDLAASEPFFIWSVARTSEGLLAAGTSPTRMALWRSEQGFVWERVWDQDAPFARSEPKHFPNTAQLKHDPVKALLGTDSGVVAVGWDRDTASVGYLGDDLFFEHDLVIGQVLAETAMTDVIDTEGGRVLAVGFSGGDVAVWVGELENE